MRRRDRAPGRVTLYKAQGRNSGHAVERLLYELDGVEELADKVKPLLQQLVAAWDG
jgi:hypothetical protein